MLASKPPLTMRLVSSGSGSEEVVVDWTAEVVVGSVVVKAVVESAVGATGAGVSMMTVPGSSPWGLIVVTVIGAVITPGPGKGLKMVT